MIHKKRLTGFLLAFTMFSFSQCKTIKKNDANSEIMKPITPIFDSYKKEISMMNSDKTLELIVSRTIKQGDPATHFFYKVRNTTTKEIIKDGHYRGSKIEWNDVTSLKLTPYIGTLYVPDPKKNDNSSLTKDKTQTQITIINLNN
ncbi:hypothetical protein ABW636_06205 [Aquimarina sp. 2201CG1-2-11]|uniref:hypothetical protein n=1 Tax=Aquimarina discodermiae TaxID=3231043 RepID=UPI0034637F37